VIAGFQYERERPAGTQLDLASSEYEFVARQVRLGVRGDLSKLFRVNVSFELADALDPETGTSYSTPEYIRTATLDYRPSRAFRLTVGRFKRPFSWIQLESTADLAVLGRGLLNNLAVEDNQWGDRAVGAMVSGRVKAAKLRWYLSLTNPAWSSELTTEGLDVLGRVQVAVTKQITLGVNGGHKYLKLGQQSLNDWGFGGDVTLEIGGGRVALEGSYVDLPFETDRPRAFGALALLEYVLPLAPSWALQPVLFAEFADANAEVSQTESARIVAGVNVLGHEGFRIMPQLELVRSLGDTSQLNPWLEGETFNLIFSTVL
jgi:hypothetical protein